MTGLYITAGSVVLVGLLLWIAFQATRSSAKVKAQLEMANAGQEAQEAEDAAIRKTQDGMLDRARERQLERERKRSRLRLGNR